MKGDIKLLKSKCWLLTSPHRALRVNEQNVIAELQGECYDYCYAIEGNEQDGSFHVHFCVRYDSEVSIMRFRLFLEGWHFDAIEEFKWDKTLEYSKKEGNYFHLREIIPAPYDNRFPEWRKWQQKLLGLIEKNEQRKVICVVDEKGGAGKTYFAMWHACRHLAAYIPCMSYRDILRMAYAIPVPPMMYIFDIPRALTKKHMREIYASAETLRNGYCYDDRYEWKSRFFDPKPVIIYTNTMPDIEQLSADRWVYVFPELIH